jgi:hypothetical protein
MNTFTPDTKPSLILFSALGSPAFRSIKLRSRKPTCPACGTKGQNVGQVTNLDYAQFCGGESPNWEQQGLVKGDAGYRIYARVRSIDVFVSASLKFYTTFVGRNSKMFWSRQIK